MDEEDGLGDLLGQPAEAFDSQSFWDAMDLVQDHHIEAIEAKLWEKILALYHLLTDVLLLGHHQLCHLYGGSDGLGVGPTGKAEKGCS